MLLQTPLILPAIPSPGGCGPGAGGSHDLACGGRVSCRSIGADGASHLCTNAAAAALGPGVARPARVTQPAVELHERLSFLHLPIRDKGLELNTLNAAFNDVTVGAAN